MASGCSPLTAQEIVSRVHREAVVPRPCAVTAVPAMGTKHRGSPARGKQLLGWMSGAQQGTGILIRHLSAPEPKQSLGLVHFPGLNHSHTSLFSPAQPQEKTNLGRKESSPLLPPRFTPAPEVSTTGKERWEPPAAS